MNEALCAIGKLSDTFYALTRAISRKYARESDAQMRAARIHRGIDTHLRAALYDAFGASANIRALDESRDILRLQYAILPCTKWCHISRDSCARYLLSILEKLRDGVLDATESSRFVETIDAMHDALREEYRNIAQIHRARLFAR